MEDKNAKNETQETLDILEIEKQIDLAIEDEDYEKLNTLLDQREKLLPILPENTLREIYERDLKRQENLKQKFEELKSLTKNIEDGKRMVQSYIQQDDKGQILNRQG
ncbi:MULTISPECIES: flagellar protein FliT [Fervidobacterium]|uniref:Flagellar protein FliT n=1 Tax=Fervidobacterium nodosum (strain ATCC 35602 / DSM 5306 / Rt17-B1) TaxID=381764 RepID=A7HNV3_FERNB|nr:MULTISPECIES: flagellar protein FliT [Fervidobacterium]ABS61586.1 hypothetical protein Fnod_1753 [Fervidobacterium nodosum Rt17-B1]KAF2961868.1 hypothetical protein AS161_07175 [Fervidobacterium sp. 2310opik-2]HOJ94066.1 flagellar protein FliT [Fervidobacterium nodosum]